MRAMFYARLAHLIFSCPDARSPDWACETQATRRASELRKARAQVRRPRALQGDLSDGLSFDSRLKWVKQRRAVACAWRSPAFPSRARPAQKELGDQFPCSPTSERFSSTLKQARKAFIELRTVI